MKLRNQLLTLSLVTLLVPWFGWKLVQELERFLRAGQESALLASATTVSQALPAEYQSNLMFGRENENRVIVEIALFQSCNEFPDVVVDALHHPVILRHFPLTSVLRFRPARRRPSILVVSSRLLHKRIIEHRIVGSPHRIGSMRIRDTDHVGKGLIFVFFYEFDRSIGEPVGREALFVRPLYRVGRLAFVISRFYPRAIWSKFELLPVSSEHHRPCWRGSIAPLWIYLG